MGKHKDEYSNGTTIAIFLVILAIIVVVFFLLIDSPTNKGLSCKTILENNIPTNGDVKIKVIAYGENATIQTKDGQNTNQKTYEMTAKENGTYTFYAVSGEKKEACRATIINIDKNSPTASMYVENKEREIATRLVIKAKDDVKLAKKPYSWDNKTWTNKNYLIVSSNGQYTAYVKDEAGNVTKIHYTVTNIGNPTVVKHLDMYTGTSKTLKVDEGTVDVWKNNNSSVATVDVNGKVTAKVAGMVTITAVLDSGDMYQFVIEVTKAKVTAITLNRSSAQIKAKETVKLSISKIEPSYAKCDSVTWTSSNTKVAKVSSGVVTGVSDGSATITANCDGKTAKASITVKSIDPPVVPTGTIVTKYEGATFKYYIVNKTSYYLTYIWMEDPYNQIRKLDATTSVYGKVMTDSEITSKGYTPQTRNVGEMMNSYIKYGILPASKAAVGYNASGFYVKGAWNPPSDYYHNRSSSWFVMIDGTVTRNRPNDSAELKRSIIGIAPNGDLKIYKGVSDTAGRQKVYDSIMKDKIKNTWSFDPQLVGTYSGQTVTTSWKTEMDQRQGICQLNSNNYIMLTSIYDTSYKEMGELLLKLGCKTAFNLDGGGSASLFYKKPGTNVVTQLKCSDGRTHTVCRSIVEGIYFTEK